MELAEFSKETLADMQVRPIERSEETQYQQQMARHHSLGALGKIGETLRYVAIWREQWVAQLSLSASALKCGVRDRWIGWDFRTPYRRLQRASRLLQARLCAVAVPRCARTTELRQAGSCATHRRSQNHAQSRTDASATAVFQDHTRSAPGPGAAPSFIGRAGHRGGRDP